MQQEFVDTRDFLSQTKFYEGYSRFKDEDTRYETWDEAVDRVIEMHPPPLSVEIDPPRQLVDVREHQRVFVSEVDVGVQLRG